MTLSDILARYDAMLTAEPFSYRVAKEPFGFDQVPAQALDRSYCLLADDLAIDGYIGLAQAELVPVTIRLLRKSRRDTVAAYRALLADVIQLQGAIARDGVLADYNADVQTLRVPPPAPSDDFVVAEIVALVDYDHQL